MLGIRTTMVTIWPGTDDDKYATRATKCDDRGRWSEIEARSGFR